MRDAVFADDVGDSMDNYYINMPYISIRSACKMLGVGPSTVYNYIAKGTLHATVETVTEDVIRLTLEDVEAFKKTYVPKPYNKRRPKKLSTTR